MDFHPYARKPFVIDAVEITTQNIAEVAPLVGTLKEKADGTPFILVDRRLVPNLYRAYPGFYLTRMGDQIRCYTPRIFKEQFCPLTPEIKSWVDFMAQENG